MTDGFAALIPELSVSDARTSVAFYTNILGFSLRYDRPEEGFAFLDRDGVQIMLDQVGVGRDFDPLLKTLAQPWGRGVNLQIRVTDVAVLLAALAHANWPLVLPVEDRWYRQDKVMVGNRQFVVADPDGYLLRFFQDLGARPI